MVAIRKPRGPKAAPPAEPQREEVTPEKRAAVLARLSQIASTKRKEAIDYRVSSGIERIWSEDEDAYEGIDDANRHEHAPAGGLLSGGNKPGTGGVEPDKVTGCTLLPNITQPYVDTAGSKVSDMLMPTDERNFVIEAPAIPDVLDEEEGFPEVPVPQAVTQQIQPANHAAAIMGQPAAAAEGQDPVKEALRLAIAKLEAIRQRAKQAAEKAQKKIDDHLAECQYQAEVRQAIDDAAKVGTGVLKGPYAVKKTRTVRVRSAGEVIEVVKEETVPASRRIDYWNVFPAPGSGQDIQTGDHFWERDFLTRKQLTELAGGSGPAAYFDDQIAEVLKEGPQKRKAEAIGRRQEEELDEKTVYEVWYGYMTLTGDDLTALGCECKDPLASYDALLTIVNDRIIKAARNPLDSGKFPYDFLPWKRRKGMPWGLGIARQGRVAQRGYTAAYRNLMDNAGASAKPHKVSSGVLMQVEGDPWSWTFDPDDVGTPDARAAMQFIIQPSLQAELSAIIQMHQQMMELHTGLPMIMLGLQGNVEETAHGRALQNNNGTAVLRRVARLFDSCLTEPHIGRYYDWMRQYSDDDQITRGAFVVKARGSSALVERDIQNQFLPTIANMSLQPAFEMDPKLAARQLLQSQRLDPDAFELTDERKKELQERAKQMQVPPPQVAVAQIREQGETQRLQMELGAQAQENAKDAQLKLLLAQVQERIESIKDQGAREIAFNDLKAMLAATTLKLNTQRELSAHEQVLKPPTEPAGRAQPGRAFTQ